MKIKRKAYPHPVLAEFNDDYKGSVFKAALIEVTPEKEGIVEFKVKFHLKNKRLEDLIKNNGAIFVTHIECGSSMYRKAFTTINSEFSFFIPQKKLTKEVDVSFMIVANTTIADYKNELLHDDYDGVALTFKKGSYLAVDPGLSLAIEKVPIVDPKSIFSLHPSKEENPAPYELNYSNGVIDIYLPQNVFDQVEEIQRYEQVNPLLVTMYYLPALMDALTYMCELEQGASEDIAQDSDWYISILYQLVQLQIDPKKINDIGASVIAHRILKSFADEALNLISDLFTTE